jgi:hypothetical protein
MKNFIIFLGKSCEILLDFFTKMGLRYLQGGSKGLATARSKKQKMLKLMKRLLQRRKLLKLFKQFSLSLSLSLSL